MFMIIMLVMIFFATVDVCGVTGAFPHFWADGMRFNARNRSPKPCRLVAGMVWAQDDTQHGLRHVLGFEHAFISGCHAPVVALTGAGNHYITAADPWFLPRVTFWRQRFVARPAHYR